MADMTAARQFDRMSAKSHSGRPRLAWAGALLLILLLPAACAAPTRPPAQGGQVFQAVGVASWYGGKFHGRRTANGEIYDQNGPTAAHKTLPFGTRVRVVNLENGRATVLRINDRGPFVRGRIIDVSRRAAEVLGFRSKGLARVGLQIVKRGGG
jgi:peptidoglycan lytic transglycosylase